MKDKPLAKLGVVLVVAWLISNVVGAMLATLLGILLYEIGA